MARVGFSPEAVRSFRTLPPTVRAEFAAVISDLASRPRLRLPGEFNTHQLEGARGLWTLKVRPFRGIYHWDGHELRFLRFGSRSQIYTNLPK